MGHKMETELEKLNHKLGLPADILPGLPVLHVYGFCKMEIENFKSLREYTSECIRIRTNHREIEITGERLALESFNTDSLLLCGNIKSILLKEELM